MGRIDELLMGERTSVDFKVALEEKKPKSWLKSICAFANGVGGSLVYGIADETFEIVGLENLQETGEKISKTIEKYIVPLPPFELIAHEYKGAKLLEVKVKSGANTPYYYENGGVKETFIRNGSDSLPAPEHMLHELILKGTRQSFDAIVTKEKRNDYSFTLFEATFLERTNTHIESSDYVSFGLATTEGYLTNAGKLLADQHLIYNSRVFCTRWSGLEKGSIFEDALDDKEFEGNLIYLKKSVEEFVKNNSRKKYKKQSTYRIDQPDYSERAVTEAIVNALIHRMYTFQGSEIHVDMYDDRLEIVSPGGMPDGGNVKDRDIYNIESFRRNPIIADNFNRLRFMERRGSGLKDIVRYTEKLSGYTEDKKPEFISTNTSFKVVLKNVNYVLTDQAADQATNQAADQAKYNLSDVENAIIGQIRQNNKITQKQIALEINEKLSTVKYYMEELKKKQIISREGTSQNGMWIIKSL